MAIASVNALVMQLTEEKSILEQQRTVIDERRQTLALHQAYMYEEYSQKLMQQSAKESAKEEEALVDDDIDEEDFLQQYQAAVAQLDNQDKFLEMERTNLQTKLDAVTASLESAEKRLNKNIESEMKSLGS